MVHQYPDMRFILEVHYMYIHLDADLKSNQSWNGTCLYSADFISFIQTFALK